MNQTDLREMIALYLKAEKEVLSGQAYEMGGRKLTMANLREIVATRKEYERRLNALNRGGRSHSLARFQ